MRVLLVYRKSTSLGTGGVENYFKILYQYFSKQIIYYPMLKNPENTVCKNIVRLIFDFLKYFSISMAFDLIHVNPSFRKNSLIRDGILIKWAQLKGKKTLVFFRGWDKDFENEIKKKWFSIFKISYLKSDGIIVLSNSFKECIKEMGYKGQIFLENTIVDDNIFPKKIFLTKDDRKILNILFMARIVKKKGIYEAIDTILEIQKKYEVNFLVAGDGADLKPSKKYAEEKKVKNIKFLGYIRNDEKVRVLKLSDIFLFPSYEEGMPNAVLEAMAFGLPIVTRPVGGIKDFFQNGKMGYVCQSMDPKEFSELIETLIVNSKLRYEIGYFNHQYAKNNFKASTAASRIEKIYQKLL